MSHLASLHIGDLRPRLDIQASDCRRMRVGAITSLTLHYNGPACAAAGNPGRELAHIVTVDVPNHQSRIGADSLMYHYCVLSDGAIWQTRNLELIAWHCRNSEGNEHSLAIHLPLGGAQDATETQWAATCALFEALIADYGLTRQDVKGHREWASTLCPGPNLTKRLLAWRAEQPSMLGAGWYRVVDTVDYAVVREGPGLQFKQALGGVARLLPNAMAYFDGVTLGGPISQDRRWLHWATGIGFVHVSCLAPTVSNR